jgi:serine/threonine protein phosphatase 1
MASAPLANVNRCLLTNSTSCRKVGGLGVRKDGGFGMAGVLRRFFSRGAAPGDPAVLPPLAPAERLCVVGDVHGMFDLLQRLLPQLSGRIVLVGDVIDRGPHSAAVLDLLMARPDLTVLMGNHEAMLLNFLDDPVTAGPSWLRHGGLQTLESLGAGGDLSVAGLPRLRDRLALALGDERIEWIRSRPRHLVSGNIAVTHAGADPARPVDAQTRALIWGHPDNGRLPRSDGLWIAQGHVIVDEVTVGAGRILTDTGAFAGGPLSAIVIEPAGGWHVVTSRT